MSQKAPKSFSMLTKAIIVLVFILLCLFLFLYNKATVNALIPVDYARDITDTHTSFKAGCALPPAPEPEQNPEPESSPQPASK